MYYISNMKTQKQTTETLLEQPVEGMFRSKVDIETSDIFFNFGTPLRDTYIKDIQDRHIHTRHVLNKDRYKEILLEDATNFLDIVYREGITPQDLVDDFNNRI